MAIQFSDAVRNARADAVESTTGTSAVLTIRTGAQPANCAAANSGTVLATLNLPSDWMSAASSGAKAMTGTWQDTSADASGTAAHFRIHNNGGGTCHMQGSCGTASADLILDNNVFVAGQSISITAFGWTEPNG